MSWLQNVHRVCGTVLSSMLRVQWQGKFHSHRINPFQTVEEFVADPFTTAKVTFFLSVANEVTPFLTLYQTDKPMLPFLATDQYNMLGGLMRRFIETAVISEVKTPLIEAYKT